jgi:hypothetical protein
MGQQFELRRVDQNANEVLVTSEHGSQFVPRHMLCKSPVLSQVLNELDVQGSAGSVTSHAPHGLLSAWLQHRCTDTDITSMETETLLEYLKVCIHVLLVFGI